VRPPFALADAAIFGLVVAAPLAVGTVHPLAWVAASVVAVVALLIAAQSPGAAVSPGTAVLGVVALSGACVLLPLIPLPPTWVQVLSPEAHALWSRGPATGVAGGWWPLHQAPALGVVATLQWVFLSAFALAVSLRAQDGPWRLKAPLAIVVAGLVSSSVCLVQSLAETTTILGVYTPRQPVSGFLRPTMVNPNHWGAWMGVVLVAAADVAARDTERARYRTLAVMTGAAAVLQLVLGDSRSGPLGAGAGVLAWFVLRALAPGATGARRWIHAATAAALTLAGALWLIAGSAAPVEYDTGESIEFTEAEPRLRNLPQVRELVSANRWTGVGRGAFRDSFPRFRQAHGRDVMAWAEVLPLEILADLGVPVGLLVALVLLLGVGATVRRSLRDPTVAWGAAVLIGALVHDLADFSLETGAVALPVVLGAVVAGGSAAGHASRRGLSVALALLLGTGAAATAQVLHSGHPRDLVGAAAARVESGASSWDTEAARVWRSRPGSFVVAMELSERFAAADDPSGALAWAGRAMVLAPGHPDPHILAAQLLRPLGAHKQSLNEYRLAVGRTHRTHLKWLLPEIVAHHPSAADLLSLAPYDRPEYLPWVALYLQRAGQPAGDAVALRAVETLPDHPLAITVGARAKVRAGDPEGAVALLDRLGDDERHSTFVRAERAIVLRIAGRTEAAYLSLDRTLAMDAGDQPWVWLLRARWAIDDRRREDALLSLARARVGAPKESVAQSLVLEARLARESGNPGSAINLVMLALDVAPDPQSARLEEAHSLIELGRLDEAAVRLGRLTPDADVATLQALIEQRRGSTR